MTFSEFQKLVSAIQAEEFHSTTSDALTMGIQRCRFEEAQIARLLKLAKQSGIPTALKKMVIWEARLNRKIAARQRFERLKMELKPRPISLALLNRSVMAKDLSIQRTTAQTS